MIALWIVTKLKMVGKENCNVNNPAELQDPRFVEISGGRPGTLRPLFSILALCLIFLAFLAFAFALQHKGFNSAMVYDGAALIHNNAAKFAEHDPGKIMRLVPVRPLFMLSLYYNYVLAGMEPYYFRIGNMLVVAAGGLVSGVAVYDRFRNSSSGVAGYEVLQTGCECFPRFAVCRPSLTELCRSLRMAARSQHGLLFLLFDPCHVSGSAFRPLPPYGPGLHPHGYTVSGRTIEQGESGHSPRGIRFGRSNSVSPNS